MIQFCFDATNFTSTLKRIACGECNHVQDFNFFCSLSFLGWKVLSSSFPLNDVYFYKFFIRNFDFERLSDDITTPWSTKTLWDILNAAAFVFALFLAGALLSECNQQKRSKWKV